MKSIPVTVVDENPIFLEIFSRFLREECPNEVTLLGTTASYAEAEAQAQRLRPKVIFVDHGLPGQRGLYWVSRLRRLVPEVGIIVLTLLDKADFRKSALDAGADEFLQKDDVFRSLLPAIHRVITARSRENTKSTRNQ